MIKDKHITRQINTDMNLPRFSRHLLITQEVANAKIYTTQKDVAVHERF
jgi:hypothetical protein